MNGQVGMAFRIEEPVGNGEDTEHDLSEMGPYPLDVEEMGSENRGRHALVIFPTLEKAK
jgi:hypothetical protein